MMRDSIVRALGRPTALVLLLALSSTACAHRSAAIADAPPAPSRPVANEPEGYAFDLPTSQDFRPGTGRDNIVVRSSTGVRVRVFPEHFPRPPDESACWERLLVQHVPPTVTSRPSTPQGLAEAASGAGLAAGDGRLIFLKPVPRGNECVVAVVEGTPGPARLTAATVLGSFRVFEPDPMVRRHLLIDAGLQLRRMNEPEAALDRFEALFASGETNPRALALAGALAFQMGGARLPLAIVWLEQAVSLPPELAFPESFPSEANALYAETLMNLGLAYAQSGSHAKAVARLAEAAVRVPDDAVILYNFACGLALGGKPDQAFAQLREAFALDPALAEHALSDPDLTSLRSQPEWEPTLAAARRGQPTD